MRRATSLPSLRKIDRGNLENSIPSERDISSRSCARIALTQRSETETTPLLDERENESEVIVLESEDFMIPDGETDMSLWIRTKRELMNERDWKWCWLYISNFIMFWLERTVWVRHSIVVGFRRLYWTLWVTRWFVERAQGVEREENKSPYWPIINIWMPADVLDVALVTFYGIRSAAKTLGLTFDWDLNACRFILCAWLVGRIMKFIADLKWRLKQPTTSFELIYERIRKDNDNNNTFSLLIMLQEVSASGEEDRRNGMRKLYERVKQAYSSTDLENYEFKLGFMDEPLNMHMVHRGMHPHHD